MKSVLSATLKILGIFVLACVVVVIVVVMAYGVSQSAKRSARNNAIDVLKMYASPPNNTLADRLFVIKNTSGKTINAIKFRVVVFNQLKEKVDDTVVGFEKSITPDHIVYCNEYSIYDAESGLQTDSGCNVNNTNRRLLDLAQQAGCKPEQLQVKYRYKVKVISVAY